MKKKERIIIAGMAGVSNLGIDLTTYFENLKNGYTKMSPIEFDSPLKYHTTFGGKVDARDIEIMKARITPLLGGKPFNYEKWKETFYSIYCLHEILRVCKTLPKRTGLIVGSGCGCINSIEEDYINMFINKKVNPLSIVEGMSNYISGYLTMLFQINGPSFIISSACSSGANAVGLAFKMIQMGMIDACLCGGVDCGLKEYTFKAWDQMRVLSRNNEAPNRAMKPFSKKRDGFVLSEGAAYLLLVREGILSEYSYPCYAEVAGYSTTSDGAHLTRPNTETQVECITNALEDADLSPEEVDYINAHGTSTPLNDITETNAIKRVFGDLAYQIPISSTKSMLGHTLGASGVLELLAAVLCMNNGIIHPTINYEPDEECDLNYVPNTFIKKEVKTFLKNSFGFGGSNTCLVVRKG